MVVWISLHKFWSTLRYKWWFSYCLHKFWSILRNKLWIVSLFLHLHDVILSNNCIIILSYVMAGVDLSKAGLTFAQRMMQRKQNWLGWVGHGWHFGTFGTFWNVLGRLKPIYCITIFKQVSTCSKDDAIIQRGNGLGWPWLALIGLGWTWARLVWPDICSKDNAKKTNHCIMLG